MARGEGSKSRRWLKRLAERPRTPVEEVPCDVLLCLSHDEALVLSDWLHRCAGSAALTPTTVDHGEVIAVSNLLCLLECEMVEPFMHNYEELVAAARLRLRGDDGMSDNTVPSRYP